MAHPSPDGPHVIEDDTPNFRVTKKFKRAALGSRRIFGSCPRPQQEASTQYSLTFICDFAGSVLDTETGELLEYCHLIKHPKFKEDWGYSFWNEIRRLAQGMPGRNTGTNPIKFINKSEMPLDTVCLPSTNNYFYICFCSRPDGKKQTNLGEAIPTRHHLSSTNQNWQRYWSLIKPKSELSCSIFFSGRIGRTQSPWKSEWLEPFWSLRNKIAPHGTGHFPIQIHSLCTLCWEFNLLSLS